MGIPKVYSSGKDNQYLLTKTQTLTAMHISPRLMVSIFLNEGNHHYYLTNCLLTLFSKFKSDQQGD